MRSCAFQRRRSPALFSRLVAHHSQGQSGGLVFVGKLRQIGANVAGQFVNQAQDVGLTFCGCHGWLLSKQNRILIVYIERLSKNFSGWHYCPPGI